MAPGRSRKISPPDNVCREEDQTLPLLTETVYSNHFCDNGLRPVEAEHVEITARPQLVSAADAMSDPCWPAPEGHV